MEDSVEIFDKVVNARRSARIYDEQATWDASAVQRSLERATLAPNSSNLQLWEFYRVFSKEKKEQLAKICLGQKAAKTANELIVFVARKDKWKQRSKYVFNQAIKDVNDDTARIKMLNDYYNKIIPLLYGNDFLNIFSLVKKMAVNVIGWSKPMTREVTASDMRVVVHKSTALAAQTFMLSMKAEGFDSCPMEGFDSKRAKKLLGLPKAAEVTMIISVGTAKMPEGIFGPRVRVDLEDVIFNI